MTDMDKRRLPSTFLPCSCVANRPTGACVVCIMRCGWKETRRKRGRMNRRARQEVGNTTLCRSGVGGRARRAAKAEWERDCRSLSFVWRDLTKWRFVQKTTTLYSNCEREGRDGGMDGWRAIRVPLFNCNQDTLHRTPSNLATRRLAFFPTTKWLLSSRPNLLLIPPLSIMSMSVVVKLGQIITSAPLLLFAGKNI